MYKRIMVPLDGSKLAEIALPYAEEIARHMGSEVILVNARGAAEDPDKPEHRIYISKMAATTEQNLKKSPDLPHGERVKVVSAIVGSPGLSHPAEEIVNYADKENISLIVMATHGSTGIRRWALGSTANKVARAAKCPVLLIRAAAKVPQKVHLDKILVPLDGSKPSEAALAYAGTLASKIKARIIVLNVVEPPYHVYAYAQDPGFYGGAGIVRIPYTDEELKPYKAVAEKYAHRVSDKLMEEGIKASFEVKAGSPGEEIIRAEAEIHPDLVVMSTHGHSGFGRLENGSVADRVLHFGNVALLLVRPHDAGK
jgi:nucleotide-binding universal stress UspA family protein